MESNGSRDSVRQQLDEMERGESASWLVSPATPRWWPVAFGVWAAVLALVAGLLEGASRSLMQVVLVLAMGLAIAWDRRRRGTYPAGRAPRELRRVIWWMVLGSVAVAGTAWLAGELLNVWVAAVVAGVGAFAVVALYEREYAAVAARIRGRLR